MKINESKISEQIAKKLMEEMSDMVEQALNEINLNEDDETEEDDDIAGALEYLRDEFDEEEIKYAAYIMGRDKEPLSRIDDFYNRACNALADYADDNDLDEDWYADRYTVDEIFMKL